MTPLEHKVGDSDSGDDAEEEKHAFEILRWDTKGERENKRSGEGNHDGDKSGNDMFGRGFDADPARERDKDVGHCDNQLSAERERDHGPEEIRLQKGQTNAQTKTS